MRSTRPSRPKFNRELLLLLGALAVFAFGSGWIVHRARAGRAEPRAWIGALPSIGLPLLHSLRLR